MTDIVARLRPLREMLRSMTDEQRVKFIAQKFISVWESTQDLEPGTLPLDEQFYWNQIAEQLVNAHDGNRDPELLLYEAYKTMRHLLPKDDSESSFDYISIFTDISTIMVEATARSAGAVVGAVSIVGDSAIAGGKAVLTTAGEKTKEKIVETVEAFVGSYENVAYLSIAAGLIGTTVIYFRR